MSTDAELEQRLGELRQLMDAGALVAARPKCEQLLLAYPRRPEPFKLAARLAALRGDLATAGIRLGQALTLNPGDAAVAFDVAMLRFNQSDLDGATQALAAALALTPSAQDCWLLLGHVRQQLGQQQLALKAWFQAIDRAQSHGRWLDERSTPKALLPMVLAAMEALQTGRRALFEQSLAPVRGQVGSDALKRVDRALAHYLRLSNDGPRDARQRPKFLFFPGLPEQPYHDPALHPWTTILREAYPDIRAEALGLLGDDQNFESFLSFGPGAKVEDYVGGHGPRPSWDAFFFYRHGQRFDAHHERCPKTSEALESIDLCRIRDQAPEICFSVLAPGSHIKAHHGVTNTRLVMHLPLKIPHDCALNVINGGEHHWQEGQLMMFDDTFQHEAWNRSDESRVILLMDCWNPHLTAAEKLAVTSLVECISEFENRG